MKTIKVHFDNGNSLVTGINGTQEEIEKYYLNNRFNLGNGSEDKMATCVKIEFI